MKVEFEPIPKRFTRGTFGWLKIDGKRYTTIRKDKNGSLVILLYKDGEWDIRPASGGRKGTVALVHPPQ